MAGRGAGGFRLVGSGSGGGGRPFNGKGGGGLLIGNDLGIPRGKGGILLLPLGPKEVAAGFLAIPAAGMTDLFGGVGGPRPFKLRRLDGCGALFCFKDLLPKLFWTVSTVSSPMPVNRLPPFFCLCFAFISL